jgi:hypothetical protein
MIKILHIHLITGNEAEYSHRWYNLSALLLLPEINRYDLILCPSNANGKLVYDINYELWTVLNKLKECKSSEDNSIVTSATLDFIMEGIYKSKIELTHSFRIPLLHCLIALALLNRTNPQVIFIVKDLIVQNLVTKSFFSAFSGSYYGMFERMADVLFDAGNLLNWTIIADQMLSLYREEIQSSKYLSESYLEDKFKFITSFLIKFISLVKTKR